MKKIMIIFMCLLMIGCTIKQEDSSVSESTNVDESQWAGNYVCGDVKLIIAIEDDYDGIVFDIEMDEEGFGNYAYFKDETHLEAISDIQEDGYTLEFSLKKDKVIVKESGGTSYLLIDFSGEYMRE